MQKVTERNLNLLIIDNDLEVAQALARQFKAKYTVFFATSAEEGFSIMQVEYIQVVISTQKTLGMIGVNFFATINDKYPDSITLILTDYTDLETSLAGINHRQVLHCLKKKWYPAELDAILMEAFEKSELIRTNRVLIENLQKAKAELEEIVSKRTNELKSLNIISTEIQNHFQLLYDNAPLSYQSLNSQACLIDVNKRWLETLGYEKEEVIGRYFGDFMTPESAELIAERFSTFVATGSLRDYIFNMVRKDGTIITVTYDGTIGYDELGSFKQTHCIFQDVTQKKVFEKKINDSEERFRTIFESSLVAKSITALDGTLDVNAAYSEVLGYSKEELNAMNWRDITHKEDIEFNEQIIRTILQGEQNSSRWEKRFIHKDGYIVWADITTLLKRDDKGNPLYYITELVDISQRKKAEKELEESEYRYRSLVNKGQALIWTSGLDKKCNYFNETWLAFTGRTLEQELGDGWLEGVHPADLQNCKDIYVDGFNHRKSFSMEYRIRHTSGEYRWIQDDGSPRYDSNGEFLGFIGHCLDINERKQVDVSLAKIQQLHNEMERVGKVGGWEFNIDTLISVWTEETYRIHEVDYVSETTVDSGENYYTPTSIPIVEEALNRAISYGESFDLELEIITAKGNFRHINVIGQADIENRRVYGFVQDITERKLTEIALKDSEVKLLALFSGMTEMVVIHELVFDTLKNVVDYRIIDCNDTFSQIIGISKEAAIGKLASEVYNTQETPYLEEYSNVCHTGEKLQFQSYFQPMDKHFLVSAIPLENNQFATVTTDITVIQHSKEAILRNNKDLENYIYVASHDLRSPLVNIQGFSQRLQNQTVELQRIFEEDGLEVDNRLEIKRIAGENMSKSLKYIQTNVTKMDRLINGLLQVSRTGRMAMNPRQIDMNKLMASIIGSYNYQLTEIHACVKINQLSNCYGDEGQLNALFSNLISNAIKYRSNERRLTIEISSENQYDKVLFSIRDNGIGIHQKYQEKIWDVFYRVDGTNDEGDGIGLSIVKRIVDKHKGRIWLESEDGVGSIFYVQLQKNEFDI